MLSRDKAKEEVLLRDVCRQYEVPLDLLRRLSEIERKYYLKRNPYGIQRDIEEVLSSELDSHGGTA